MACTEVINGELVLDYGILQKQGGLMVENWKSNEIKCERSLLEVSCYWILVLQSTEGFSGPFPRVGEDDL